MTRLTAVLGGGAIGAILAVQIANIVLRGSGATPLDWADEFAAIALLWLVFAAAALWLRDDEHVAFDLVTNALPPPARRVAMAFGGLALAALAASVLPGAADYALFLWRERTSALEWRQDIVTSVFVLFVASLLVRGLVIAVRARRA